MANDIDPCRSTIDLENSKFAENSDGKVVIRIEDESVGGLLRGVIYDAVDVDYPSATTETYEFYTGGLAGTLQATITLTYTDATKDDLDTAVRT